MLLARLRADRASVLSKEGMLVLTMRKLPEMVAIVWIAAIGVLEVTEEQRKLKHGRESLGLRQALRQHARAFKRASLRHIDTRLVALRTAVAVRWAHYFAARLAILLV